jgi:hypothetical protein
VLGPPKPRRLDVPTVVSLENLIPQNHFYRHLQAKLDLSFVIAAGQNLKRFLAASGWGPRNAPRGSLLALPGDRQGLSAAFG